MFLLLRLFEIYSGFYLDVKVGQSLSYYKDRQMLKFDVVLRLIANTGDNGRL